MNANDATDAFKLNKLKPASEEFVSANILHAKAATNCPRGGDAGHGGVTVIELRDEAGTCWTVIADGVVVEQPRSIQLVLQGDCECVTIVDALRWAANTLEAQQRENQANKRKV